MVKDKLYCVWKQDQFVEVLSIVRAKHSFYIAYNNHYLFRECFAPTHLVCFIFVYEKE